jgi:transposase-like protein
MSRSTISTFQLFAMFPDQETARVYLESRLWPNGVRCPVCGLGERITTRKGGFYRCNQCKEDFTVRTGTIFERSHVPLHKWIYAMYLVVTARKGISSMQLAKEIGVTQKTAWFILGRLREACGDNLDKLRGIVEIDETRVGGLAKNMHKDERDRRKNVRTGGGGKSVVLGNHRAGEYARDGVSTNSIESVWAVLKRGIHGTFHHVSPKHLGRYVDEFTFRLNEGNVERHTLQRLDSFVDGTAGKRLTYKRLIG